MNYVSINDPAIFLTIFLSSLLGSIHCLGMCGPITLSFAKTKRSILTYHLGRMISYTSLGIFAGFLGLKTFQVNKGFLGEYSLYFLSVSFFVLGLSIIFKSKFHIILPSSLMIPYEWAMRKSSESSDFKNFFSFIIGLFSILLPCGWLYGYVLGAVSTGSPIRGGLLMFSFWLGTVPVLYTTPWIFDKLLRPIKDKYPRVGGVILIVMSLIIFFNKFMRF